MASGTDAWRDCARIVHRSDVGHQPGWRGRRAGRIRSSAPHPDRNRLSALSRGAQGGTARAAGAGSRTNWIVPPEPAMRLAACTPKRRWRCCGRRASRPQRYAPAAVTDKLFVTAPTPATPCRSAIQHCWPNSPASAWLRISAAVTSPPAARARRSRRPFTPLCSELITHRVIVNIGGIANLSDLPANGAVTGFDTGPGNVLLDLWIHRHLGEPHDSAGAWAQGGTVLADMLRGNAGRAVFCAAPAQELRQGSVQCRLAGENSRCCRSGAGCPGHARRTQCPLDRRRPWSSIARTADELYVCGGGAHNLDLLERLRRNLPRCRIDTTAALGTDPDWVEAIAFAWLAQQTLAGRPANLPAVTGAGGDRVLGAIYPA